MTFEDLRKFDKIKESLIGSSAVELRVDLLKEDGQEGAIVSTTYLAEQISYLRTATDIPIIFTVRTVSQGGKFPDGAETEADKLIRLAFKLGVEYVDLELTWSNPFIESLVKARGYTKIVASHHNVSGNLKWDSAIWEDYYQRALDIGDVIKFVGSAHTVDDNIKLEIFRSAHTKSHSLQLTWARLAVSQGS